MGGGRFGSGEEYDRMAGSKKGGANSHFDRMNRIHRMDRRGSRGIENWKTGNYE